MQKHMNEHDRFEMNRVSWQSELFPSQIRVSALSFSGTCGRFGALLAPAIIED